jgi:hypothetical protein
MRDVRLRNRYFEELLDGFFNWDTVTNGALAQNIIESTTFNDD